MEKREVEEEYLLAKMEGEKEKVENWKRKRARKYIDRQR